MGKKKQLRKALKHITSLYVRAEIGNRMLVATLKAIASSSPIDNQNEHKEEVVAEETLEEALVHKTKFAEMHEVNGHNVSGVIKSHPEWTNTEVAAYIGGGVSHQFITAWKLYHTDWKV